MPCRTTYKVVHMRDHLDTSFCLIRSTKILLDMYDEELNLQNQEELWMNDEETTDSVFENVVPIVT